MASTAGGCDYHGGNWNYFANTIAPFFADHYVRAYSGDNVYWQVTGTAGHHVAIVQWDIVHHYIGEGVVTFQVKLHEDSDAIEVAWGELTHGGSGNDGNIVGIVNAAGNARTTYAYFGTTGMEAVSGGSVTFGPSNPPLPAPELPTVALAGLGLVVVLGVVMLRRK
jgi:hypothetical protein